MRSSCRKWYLVIFNLCEVTENLVLGINVMPIKWIDSRPDKQCTAQAKSTGLRCLNPAAYGCRTCRVHGARKQNSIKRGNSHPNYLHGMETLDAKRLRREAFSQLRRHEIELRRMGIID